MESLHCDRDGVGDRRELDADRQVRLWRNGGDEPDSLLLLYFR